MEKIIKYWFYFLSYVAVFLLGGYSAATFIYGDPLPLGKFVMMIFFAVAFYIVGRLNEYE